MLQRACRFVMFIGLVSIGLAHAQESSKKPVFGTITEFAPVPAVPGFQKESRLRAIMYSYRAQRDLERPVRVHRLFRSLIVRMAS